MSFRGGRVERKRGEGSSRALLRCSVRTVRGSSQALQTTAAPRAHSLEARRKTNRLKKERQSGSRPPAGWEPSGRSTTEGVLAAVSSALSTSASPHHRSHPCYPIFCSAAHLNTGSRHPRAPRQPASSRPTTHYPVPSDAGTIPRKLRFCTSGSNTTALPYVRAPGARKLGVKEHAHNYRRHLVLGPREAAGLRRQLREKVTEHMIEECEIDNGK